MKLNAKYLIESALMEAYPDYVTKSELRDKLRVGDHQVWKLLVELVREHERDIQRHPERGCRLATLPDLPLWLEELGSPLSHATKTWVLTEALGEKLVTVIRGLHRKPLCILPLELGKSHVRAAHFEAGLARRVDMPISEITAFSRLEPFEGSATGIARYLGIENPCAGRFGYAE